MAEREPQRRKPIKAETLASSRRVAAELIGEVDVDTAGTLIGQIDELITNHPKFLELANPPKKEKRRRTTSEDVAALQKLINKLDKDGELSEVIDKDELDEHLKEKHLQLKEEEGRRKHVRTGVLVTGSIAAVLTVGTFAVVKINEAIDESNRAHEHSITLTEDPSLPSYAGWTIRAADPNQEYVQNGAAATVQEEGSIVVGDAEGLEDTGIELRPYEKVDGEQVVWVWVPTEDPYGFRPFGEELGINRSPDSTLDREEKLTRDTDEVVILEAPDQTNHPFRIEDMTAPNAEDKTYRVTPVTETPRTQ